MSGHLQGPPQETAPDRPVLHSSAGMGHGRSGRADRRVCARSQSPSPCRRLAIAFQPDQWLASLHEYASPPCAEIVRYCRDEGCLDHDRLSGTSATCRIRQPGCRSRGRSASTQRTPSAPTVAACAVRGGRTILSPGPSSMSPPACGTRSGPARSTTPFRGRAHASGRYRRGRCPTRAGSGPRHASGLRSRLRLAAGRDAARPQRQRPSQNLITAASVVSRRGSQAVAHSASCGDRERRIIEAIRHGE